MNIQDAIAVAIILALIYGYVAVFYYFWFKPWNESINRRRKKLEERKKRFKD